MHESNFMTHSPWLTGLSKYSAAMGLVFVAAFSGNVAARDSLSNTCQFDNGPHAGTVRAFPGALPIPVGSPCHDGMGSTGKAIPNRAGTNATPRNVNGLSSLC